MQTTLSSGWITVARGPWTPSQIVCSYIDSPIPIDPAVQERIATLKADRSHRFFNGLGYRLDDFVLPSHTDNALHLSLRPTDYFTMLATDNALDEPLVIGGVSTTLRERYDIEADGMYLKPPEGIASLLGITLQIVTSDNYGIFCKRSGTATHPHTMYASLGESCSRPEDESTPGVPDITKTALRGLHEEYGLSADAGMIQWAALGADVDSGQYNLVGLVQLDMTLGEFARYLDAGEDSWEREENHAALFTPDGIANFIDKTGPWTAFGIATIQEALRARYGAVIHAATVMP